jgi:glycine betaine/proline transport system ATP-binding protein
MGDAIVVDHLTKLFGERSAEVLPRLRQSLTNTEIRGRYGVSVAVRDVSFRVRQGEIFVVMGLSGSGKSTLVRLLNGLITATAGEVCIGGRAVTAMKGTELVRFRRTTTAMVFQSFALFPHLSALENAAFGLSIAGRPRTEAVRRARAALKQVGLEGEAGRLPAELSGGMRQRVGLARALAMDPPVLLMDEAFSALDPLIRRGLQEELLELQRQRPRTIVFISHDLDEAIRLGDRIALMEGGRILQVGTPRQLLRDPADEHVRRFFRDVDAAQVLTVADLAEPPGLVLDPRRPPDPAQLRRATAADGVAYLVEGDQRYRGLLGREQLMAVPPWPPTETPPPGPTLAAATTVEEAIPVVAGAPYPVPVLGERSRFLGVVSARRLLRSLA